MFHDVPGIIDLACNDFDDHKPMKQLSYYRLNPPKLESVESGFQYRVIYTINSNLH